MAVNPTYHKIMRFLVLLLIPALAAAGSTAGRTNRNRALSSNDGVTTIEAFLQLKGPHCAPDEPRSDCGRVGCPRVLALVPQRKADGVNGCGSISSIQFGCTQVTQPCRADSYIDRMPSSVAMLGHISTHGTLRQVSPSHPCTTPQTGTVPVCGPPSTPLIRIHIHPLNIPRYFLLP